MKWVTLIKKLDIGIQFLLMAVFPFLGLASVWGYNMRLWSLIALFLLGSWQLLSTFLTWLIWEKPVFLCYGAASLVYCSLLPVISFYNVSVHYFPATLGPWLAFFCFLVPLTGAAFIFRENIKIFLD
ncbi:MAG: hypothetical protein R3350_03820 [Saprospiraceae bacterium]|nr:hypothetical protein [Saprospiraceae bacterium]